MTTEARAVLSTKLKDSKALAECIAELEASKNLTFDVNDEWPRRWVRFDARRFIDVDNELERETFRDYLQDEYFTDVDFKNECISMSDGPCIMINEDGDVLDQDSGKWIISKTDYQSVDERNKLIEEYMERAGYFPSVVSCDHYGNMHYVSTKDAPND